MKWIIISLAVALAGALFFLRAAYVDIGEANERCATDFAEYRAEAEKRTAKVKAEYERRLKAQQLRLEREIAFLERDRADLSSDLDTLNAEVAELWANMTQEEREWAKASVPPSFLGW